MIAAVECGALNLEKLEAMTCVCSVGLDMIAIPGDTPDSTIAAIIADEAAIGVINNKTTAVRLIPVYGKGIGGQGCIRRPSGHSPYNGCKQVLKFDFASRGGSIPATVHSFKN